jgi:hypothetical protein
MKGESPSIASYHVRLINYDLLGWVKRSAT